MGYLIGIDFGTKRTGLALTDPNKTIASGLKSLPTHKVISYLKVLSKTDNIECFVIGRPLQKDGSKSDVEMHIKAFIKSLKKNFLTTKLSVTTNGLPLKLHLRQWLMRV
mgnify:CR=1 FL=1